tara:strand:- start:1539 stop:2069 length:531 start_codon:yes stop_codon:yes gene_type:complete
MRVYDCSVCVHSQLYSSHKRTCFKYEVFPNGDRGKAEGDYFEIPRFGTDGRPESDEGGRVATELRFLNEDDFLETLWDICESLPSLSAFQVLSAYFREVCPTAFGDEVLACILSAQTACSDYKIDISNDAVRTDILGFHMSLADTLEAFNIITAARNAYERYDYERMSKEAKNKQS